MNKKEAQAYICDQEQVITGIGDALWENPETAFSEFFAVETICGVLEKAGFKIEKGVGNVPFYRYLWYL